MKTLTRTQVNWMVRGLLLSVGLGAFALTIIAAHPAYRYFGLYPAEFGKPQAIMADGGDPAAYITVTEPALVSFPSDWKIPDNVCMVLSLSRSNAPTSVEFNDYLPQIQWDVPPASALMFENSSVQSGASDGSTLVLNNEFLNPLLSARLPYRIQWLGQAQMPLYKDHPLGGLLCLSFVLDNKPHTPPFFSINFTAKNVHVERTPAYYFRYKDNVAPDQHPKQTLDLQPRSIDDYMAHLVNSAPFAVKAAIQ